MRRVLGYGYGFSSKPACTVVENRNSARGLGTWDLGLGIRGSAFQLSHFEAWATCLCVQEIRVTERRIRSVVFTVSVLGVG